MLNESVAESMATLKTAIKTNSASISKTVDAVSNNSSSTQKNAAALAKYELSKLERGQVGTYQTYAGDICGVSNVKTGACTCPNGFNAIALLHTNYIRRRVLHAPVVTYVCIKQGI